MADEKYTKVRIPVTHKTITIKATGYIQGVPLRDIRLQRMAMRKALRDAQASITQALACLEETDRPEPGQLLPAIDRARNRLNDLRSLLLPQGKPKGGA
jgi:hypothetical protein